MVGVARVACLGTLVSVVLVAVLEGSMVWSPGSRGGGRIWGRGGEPAELLAAPLPSISSACVKGMGKCSIAVPGGTLELTNVELGPPGQPGTADASGYIKGTFVSGRVKLSASSESEGTEPGQDKDSWWSGMPSSSQAEGGEEAKAGGGEGGASMKAAMHSGSTSKPPSLKLMRSGKVKGASPAAHRGKKKAARSSKLSANGGSQAGGGGEGGESEEYKLALAAVEKHMMSRQKKVEAEAKRIAKAVTKAISSPAMTRKIASLAVEAAASRQAAPILSNSQLAGLGTSPFGYASQPAGASSSMLTGSAEPSPIKNPSSVSPVAPAAWHAPVGQPVGMGSAWEGVKAAPNNDPWRAFRAFQQQAGQEP
jgi:hypothetical protein